MEADPYIRLPSRQGGDVNRFVGWPPMVLTSPSPYIDPGTATVYTYVYIGLVEFSNSLAL